jgi:hypothetical protein
MSRSNSRFLSLGCRAAGRHFSTMSLVKTRRTAFRAAGRLSILVPSPTRIRVRPDPRPRKVARQFAAFLLGTGTFEPSSARCARSTGMHRNHGSSDKEHGFDTITTCRLTSVGWISQGISRPIAFTSASCRICNTRTVRAVGFLKGRITSMRLVNCWRCTPMRGSCSCIAIR